MTAVADTPDTTVADEFVHEALIYRSSDEFVATALPFVRDGIERSEPVLVAVQDTNVQALARELGSDAGAADLRSVGQWYEGPARTRTKFLQWVEEHADGGRVRLLGEPPWPLDSAAVTREWARHEAVINVAFAGAPVSFICPYDARALPAAIIDHAERTHPELVHGARSAASPKFTEPAAYCRSLNVQAGAESDPAALEIDFSDHDLYSLRRLVEREAARHGLGDVRTAELVLAANEVATNALIHGAEPVRLRLRSEIGELVCEISDGGDGIHDPLAGQIKPELTGRGGLGLWAARVSADAVEIRSSASGTTVAIHVLLPSSN